MEQKELEATMALIVYGGNAKSLAFEALSAAKQKDYDKAEKLIHEAELSLKEAHAAQTNLLTREAQGEHLPLMLLSVHAQDHVMNAITFLDLAKELIEVYKMLNER